MAGHWKCGWCVSNDEHRSEVEREKGSRIAEPICPTSAANLPVVAAGKGPSRARGDRVSLWPAFCIEHSIIILISKYFEPQQRMPFFCHAWCWLHPRGGDQHIEQIWTDLGLPWPCIFWTFAHIIIYHPGMGIYEHVRASAGDAQCRLAQQLLVPSEFCAFAHDLPMICWHIMGG